MVFGLKDEVIERIRDVFRNYPEIEMAILYGSRAKEEHKPSSDIDLTLKGDNLTDSILTQVSLDLDDLLLPYLIDLSIHAHINNLDLIEHIERAGKVFYTNRHT